MQYIFTEEEFAAIKNRQTYEIQLSKKKLQKLCTEIADTMPIKWTWGSGKENPKPWGCIITQAAKGQEWYCDDCPVQSICPNEYKEHSK